MDSCELLLTNKYYFLAPKTFPAIKINTLVDEHHPVTTETILLITDHLSAWTFLLAYTKLTVWIYNTKYLEVLVKNTQGSQVAFPIF